MPACGIGRITGRKLRPAAVMMEKLHGASGAGAEQAPVQKRTGFSQVGIDQCSLGCPACGLTSLSEKLRERPQGMWKLNVGGGGRVGEGEGWQRTRM